MFRLAGDQKLRDILICDKHSKERFLFSNNVEVNLSVNPAAWGG